MARARNIKPAFFQNESLVELPYGVRLLFIGLWCLADRDGRLENRPKKIKMQLFPADDLDIPEALLGLAKEKLVTLYSVDSVEYIQIDNFLKHQHPHHKEANSVIPEPIGECKPEALPSATRLIPDSLNPITDSLQKKESKPKPKIIKQKTYPAELNLTAWQEYIDYRKESKFKKLTTRGEDKQIEKIIGFGGHDIQQQCIDETISNGWQGIFEPKGNGKAAGKQFTTSAERFMDGLRDDVGHQ